MENIRIKPHHFLDILKLHGKGLDHFLPDTDYNHDFYKIANQIIGGEPDTITFTLENYDICLPCKYNGGTCCTDTVGRTSLSKHSHNMDIDKSLIDTLNLEEGKEYSFYETIDLIKDRITINAYRTAWPEADGDEINFRYKYGMIGLGKIISRCTI